MTRARANGTPASASRWQKPAISSLSVRPINPASVTQPASSLNAIWSISKLSPYCGTVRPHQVMMVDGVEPAFGCRGRTERAADENERGPGDPRLFYLVADLAEGATDQPLVRPGDPIGDDRRTIATVMRYQPAHDLGKVVDGQMDCQSRADCSEPLERLAFRHR